jgi:hypothetical protein
VGAEPGLEAVRRGLEAIRAGGYGLQLLRELEVVALIGEPVEAQKGVGGAERSAFVAV